jgi:RNA polymerase sigma factor (sigma-70 family)
MPTLDNHRFRKLLGAFPTKAIQLLYELYYPRLLTISRHYTHDLEVSEEIIQDAFLHIWERHRWLSKYHERSIEYYLIRIIKNRSISAYQSNIRHQIKKHNYLNQQAPPTESSIEMKIIAMENHDQLRMIIDQFPLRERQCLHMKIDESLNTTEMATRLQVSKKAVERSLTSANKRLRKILESMPPKE